MSMAEVDTAEEFLKDFPCGSFSCERCPMAYAVGVDLPTGYVGCLMSDIYSRKVELIKK